MTTTVTIHLDYNRLQRAQETARVLAEMQKLRAEVQKLKGDRLKLCKIIHLVTERALDFKEENCRLKGIAVARVKFRPEKPEKVAINFPA